MEQVDAFVDAVRDTFLGVGQPPLTADEIRAKRFATTRLRPGYDEEEVDAFLEDVEARLRVRCAECGAETAEMAQICPQCGAPVGQQRLVAAGPVAGEQGDHLETAPGPAKDARPWPAWVRWLLMIFLICFLILFTIGQVGVQTTPQGTGLHNTMVGVSWLSIVGALLFLILFERARRQLAPAQVGWAVVPPLSVGFLAFMPFLWLALVRRRVLDWVVVAVYLAATATLIVALSSVPSNTSITGLPAVTWSLLLVVAPVHAVLAFSRAAKVPTWREAYPGWAAKREHPARDAAPLDEGQPDADRATRADPHRLR